MSKPTFFAALVLWKVAIVAACLWYIFAPATAPATDPGPDVDVVSITIVSTVDPLRCLASEVVLHDSRGVLYFSPPSACHSFAVMLDAGATLVDVEVTTIEPHVIEFGVDKGR